MNKKNEILDMGWNLEHSYSNLPKSLFTEIKPNPVRSPKMIILNEPLAKSLGLNALLLKSYEGIEILAGNQVPKGSVPLAQAYAGHQFGHFTMLGDGRALLIGEQITPKEERFDIQLKGSGRTPYSRGGDGRATLGPMLREYIISDAMYALGIATTRSLAVVTTGESVMRQTVQSGAVMTRVASSHIRVGTFQYVANWGTVEELQALADYTLQRHFNSQDSSPKSYLNLLKEVIERQAKLISMWQLVGFIHGVMNTDNMVISGETIDYGPCAFMDQYDPKTVFSSIDVQGRYAYGNQPSIAGWNLARFAETLLPLLDDDQDQAVILAQDEISKFPDLYHSYWLKGMREKLGIFNEEVEDESLIEALLEMMQKYQADFTNTFRALSMDKPEDTDLFEKPEFSPWYDLWQVRLGRQQETKKLSIELMQKRNPVVIPRNHRVEEALTAADKGDFSIMERLLEVLSSPYDYALERTEYTTLPETPNCKYQTFCGT